MKTVLLVSLLLVSFAVTTGYAEKNETKADENVKVLSGMSIVGNDETPKALYIVPWKGSEIAGEARLNIPVNMGYAPVDREEFKRKLDYYYFRTTSKTGR